MTTPVGGPLYQRIKHAIVERVRAGEWRPGERIPDERDLAVHFACTRVTVNRALRELALAGVVERRRKGGTRVAQGQDRPARFEIHLIDRQIEATGATYRYALLARRLVRPSARIQAQLPVAATSALLYLRCLHHADERPYQLEDRWISLAAVPQARDESFAAIGPNAWLVREVPFSSAEHVFSAANATVKEAALLQVKPRDALFVIERRTWQDGQPITYTRLAHPGGRYRMHSAASP